MSEGVKTVKCDVCGKEYKTRGALGAHVFYAHKNGSPKVHSEPDGSVKPVAQMIDVGSLIRDLELLIDKKLDEREKLRGERSVLSGDGDGVSLAGRDVEFDSLTVPRSVVVSPIVQFYYNYTQANGANYKNISEFIEDAITEHFSECLGLEVSIVKHDAFRRKDGGVGRWVR